MKRTNCSMGNFAAKFLHSVFRPEKLVNRNCSGSRGKGLLDQSKLEVCFYLKFSHAHQHRRRGSGGNMLCPSTSFCIGKKGWVWGQCQD